MGQRGQSNVFKVFKILNDIHDIPFPTGYYRDHNYSNQEPDNHCLRRSDGKMAWPAEGSTRVTTYITSLITLHSPCLRTPSTVTSSLRSEWQPPSHCTVCPGCGAQGSALSAMVSKLLNSTQTSVFIMKPIKHIFIFYFSDKLYHEVFEFKVQHLEYKLRF